VLGASSEDSVMRNAGLDPCSKVGAMVSNPPIQHTKNYVVTHKRRSKMKPRNPYVKHALFRKAGAHRKSTKAVRRKEKVATQHLS
jgi:hypothetical protein